MKTAGIIAEYNPFHNGHAYHIAETRKRTGADYIIVVMSPDFVQRGEAALLDKWSRTRCALEAGADLVLQLPAWNAVGSAEYFAEGGVSLLSHLGICDLLSFGCETEFPELLRKAAAFFSMDTEPEPYREILRQKLKEGMTFPQARAEAFGTLLPGTAFSEIRSGLTQEASVPEPDQISQIRTILDSPNNVLAIEYEKALLRMGSPMKVFPVRRIGSGHNEEAYSGAFSSASSIRSLLRSISDRSENAGSSCITGSPAGSGLSEIAIPGEDKRHGQNPPVPDRLLSSCLPERSLALLSRSLSERRLLFPDDLGLVLQMKLNDLSFLQKSGSGKASFESFWDVDPALGNRISNTLAGYTGFEEYASLLKSRQITLSRVKRALMHILLGIRREDIEEYRTAGTACYVRVLGFRKDSAPLLTSIKKNCDLPLITRLADAEALLGPAGRRMLCTDLYAASVRAILEARKSGGKVQNEYTRQLVIL